MAIYDINGNELNSAYDINGNELDYAYDIDGNMIFRKELPAGISMTVMSYNVGQWYEGQGDCVPASKDAQYYALDTGMFQRADADALFIQEYLNRFSWLPRTASSVLEPFFQYRNCRQEGTYFGRGICSKYELTNYQTHYYTSDSERYYDSADINVEGVTVTLVVTHLATDNNRFAQIVELIQYLSTLDRFICCGDFNTIGISNGHTTDNTDYQNIALPLINAGFNLANWSTHGFMKTYVDSSNGWWGCLDNIITSSNILITAAHVDDAKEYENLGNIDHMPIIADLIVVTE